MTIFQKKICSNDSHKPPFHSILIFHSSHLFFSFYYTLII